ncbi:MAG: MgtC/SapB family protein [Candidatus Bathyarchaeia archaeon]
MTMELELEGLFRLLLAVVLAFPIGYEREMTHKPAGLRTHMLIALGSATLTIASLRGFPGSDPARVAAYIVAGIGFVGAGAIIREKDKVVGITTAASLWISASIGLSSGAGLYLTALATSILGYIILSTKSMEITLIRKRKDRSQPS